MAILLAENLLPALSVSLVKIGANIPSVEFCVVTCILVMTGAMTMEMGIYANISTVYTLYNTINSKDLSDEAQDQDYDFQPVPVYYPPTEEPTEDTTTSHGKHLIYNDIDQLCINTFKTIIYIYKLLIHL